MTITSVPVGSEAASTTPNIERVDILDVGHGSCVVVRVGDDVALIDTGPGGPLLEYLRAEEIDHIHTVVISHSDADHIGGLSALLSQEIPIGQIVWNGDAIKQSTLWVDLIYQLNDLDRKGQTSAQQDASDGLRLSIGSSAVEIVLIAPNLILRRLGAGSKDREGSRITTNTVSVVAQVQVDGRSVLLVPGDLDHVGLNHLMESRDPADLISRFLLLPHHGGQLASSPSLTGQAIRRLVAAVRPESVFISNGRGKFDNPRREVIRAVRDAAPTSQISCTQLSNSCAVREILQSSSSGPYSAGWSRGHSCAGSTRITISSGTDATLDSSRHQSFLAVSVPGRLCSP